MDVQLEGVAAAHLVLEVCVVLQDGALVRACPHIVLHHILLLGQVAIKLEQRHAYSTGHVMARTAESLASPATWGGAAVGTDLPWETAPLCCLDPAGSCHSASRVRS